MTSQLTKKDLNSGRHVILYDQLYTERGELVALQKGFKKKRKITTECFSFSLLPKLHFQYL